MVSLSFLGDHNHYIRVQSKGLNLGLKNKISSLGNRLITGAYAEKAVLDKVDALLQLAEPFAEDLLMQRRIELALGNFVETMKQLPSNSTEGYLAFV